MKKTFCDLCEIEIDGENSGFGLEVNELHLHVQMTTTLNEDGETDVCKHCVLDAVYRLDNRVREA